MVLGLERKRKQKRGEDGGGVDIVLLSDAFVKKAKDHLTNVSVLLSLQRREGGKVDQGGIYKAMPWSRAGPSSPKPSHRT